MTGPFCSPHYSLFNVTPAGSSEQARRSIWKVRPGTCRVGVSGLNSPPAGGGIGGTIYKVQVLHGELELEARKYKLARSRVRSSQLHCVSQTRVFGVEGRM